MTRFRHRLSAGTGIGCGLLLVLLAAGCGPARIWSERGAAGVCREAIEAPHPDLRRAAIVRIARSGYHGSEPAVRTYGVVVRTDPSSLVRRTAARALGTSGSASAVPELEAILAHRDHADQVLPPDPHVLVETLEALRRLYAEGLRSSAADAVTPRVVRLFEAHPQRQVRCAAADLMGVLQSGEVIESLIEALGRDEFAVAYAASQALARLTGEDFGTAYEPWRDWWQANRAGAAVSAHAPIPSRHEATP